MIVGLAFFFKVEVMDTSSWPGVAKLVHDLSLACATEGEASFVQCMEPAVESTKSRDILPEAGVKNQSMFTVLVEWLRSVVRLVGDSICGICDERAYCFTTRCVYRCPSAMTVTRYTPGGTSLPEVVRPSQIIELLPVLKCLMD